MHGGKMPLVEMEVNGKKMSSDVEERQLLVHFLRDDLNLTGTHVGCDTSQCGACVIHLDGNAVKSCAMLAVQAENASIITIEGLADGDKLHPVQEAFRANHGLQCGFCTPGFLITIKELLETEKLETEEEIRKGLSGNLCRCTGYENIVKAVQELVEKRKIT